MTTVQQKDQANAKVVVRREADGCLVFLRETGDYLIFDKIGLYILENSLQQDHDQLFEEVKARSSIQDFGRNHFDTFIRMCTDVGILDKEGRFSGVMLNNRILPGSRRLSAPTSVNYQLTRYCSFRCSYCPYEAGKSRDRELNTIEVKKLLDSMADMGIFILNIGGGEAIARNDCLDILDYAYKKGICVNFATNLNKINQQTAKSLADKHVRSFRISFVAGTEKSFEQIRGEKNFRNLVRNIAHLVNYCKHSDVYFYVPLQKGNSDELPSIVKHAAGHGIKRIVFSPVLPVGRAAANKSSVVLDTEGALKAIGSAKQICGRERVLFEIEPELPPITHRRPFEGFGCECGNTSCFITSDGFVYPSSAFVGVTQAAGNIRENSLFDIWNFSREFEKLRNNFGNETCRKCKYFGRCRGGSRERSLLIDGNIKSKDPYCTAEDNIN